MILGGVLMTQVGTAALDNILTVELTGVRSEHGEILYRLCADKECHSNQRSNAYKEGSVPATRGEMQLVIDNLPEGEYSLGLFHDKNSNSKLDKNILGIPKESFGFSQLSRLPLGKPSWNETKFNVDSNQTISVKLYKLL